MQAYALLVLAFVLNPTHDYLDIYSPKICVFKAVLEPGALLALLEPFKKWGPKGGS